MLSYDLHNNSLRDRTQMLNMTLSVENNEILNRKYIVSVTSVLDGVDDADTLSDIFVRE